MSTMQEPQEPKEYVEPELSEARVAQLWARVAGGMAERASGFSGARGRFAAFSGARRWVLAAALGVAAVVGVASFRARHASEVAGLPGASFSTESEGLAMTLGDGSSLEVAPRSRFEIEEVGDGRVALGLVRGRMACDVQPDPERVFVVHAGGVEVRVIGTRFSVERVATSELSRVEVRVERGVVEVRRQDEGAAPRRLEAGDSWVIEERLGLHDAERPLPGEPMVEPPSAEPEGPGEGTPSGSPQGSAGPAPKDSKAGPPGLEEDDVARSLFAAGNEARRAGRFGDAADAFAQLVEQFPGDARTGLAAFELGRLRMDQLGDPVGAARALQRALASGPAASFREDAMARLVRVRARLGSMEQCREAKRAYARDYPRGVHRAQLAGLCETR